MPSQHTHMHRHITRKSFAGLHEGIPNVPKLNKDKWHSHMHYHGTPRLTKSTRHNTRNHSADLHDLIK
jgi:hypothetical protein